jgi:hypothetical protein
MIAAEPTDRERFIARIVGARLTGQDGVPLVDAFDPPLPRQLAAVAKRVGREVPDFLPKFLVAVDPTRDLAEVWPRFAVWLLRDVALPAITVDKWKCREAIERVARGYENGEFAHAAYAYAYAAAHAADAAANAAANAAHAADATASAAANAAAAAAAAAYAYAAANAAAYAAANAAANAAYAAANAAYGRMADKLLELVTEGTHP